MIPALRVGFIFLNGHDVTIAEKIQASADITLLTLFKEGLFYKCYNEDAMVFAKMVKNYKVNSKFVKSVRSTVFSLGFPKSELAKENLGLAGVTAKIGAKGFEENDVKIVFPLNGIRIKTDHEAWKNTIQAEIIDVVKGTATPYHQISDTTEIISTIKKFDLANSTPMQGLCFIQRLKMEMEKVKENNGNI